MASKPPTRKAAPLPTRKPQVPRTVSKPTETKRPTKSFSVGPLTGEGEGEKVLIYGQSGAGKTTLAAQVPGGVFVPIDDGARKIVNPITGDKVQAVVEAVEYWEDLRVLVQQASSLVPEKGSLIIDTITRCQPIAEAWVVENVKLEKGGRAKNLEAFGFGKGYRHELEQIRCLLSDLDKVVRSGRNVILLAQLDQTVVPNPQGIDYYQEVPKMIENKQGPIRTEVCEWSDHVLRIGYLNMEVEKDSDKARAGKVTGDAVRAIYTGGAQHYFAKSRPLNGHRLPPVVSFAEAADDSLWQYILNGAVSEE